MKRLMLLFVLSTLFTLPAPAQESAAEQAAIEQPAEKQAPATEEATDQAAIEVPDPGDFPKNPGNAIAWISLIGKWVLDFLGWATALILVLEIMVRKIPSKNNWSIIAAILGFLDNVKGILAPIFRNVKANGGYFVTKTHIENE